MRDDVILREFQREFLQRAQDSLIFAGDKSGGRRVILPSGHSYGDVPDEDR